VAADIVTLDTTVTEVEGTVPAGKKLIVLFIGKVTATKSLVIEAGGEVEVAKNPLNGALAALEATNDDIAVGSIKGAPGSVYGKGVVVLPYEEPVGVLPYEEKPAGVLTYKNAGSGNVNKAVGGLNTVSIKKFFTDNSGVNELTVYNVVDLDADAVPKDKTLTLAGAGNTITANLDLSGTAAGTLVVAEGAVLTVSANITGSTTDTNIVVKGTLALPDASATTYTIAGMVDLSKATIDASGVSTGGATLALPGTTTVAIGAINVGENQDLAISGATGLKTGSIIGTAKGVKGVEKYYLGNDNDYVGGLDDDDVVTLDSGEKTVSFVYPTTITDTARQFGGGA
jgi:hypothetical protein